MTPKPRSTKAVDDAYEYGYRRGRMEGRSEAIQFYSNRINEAVAILKAPIPIPEKD